MDQSVSVSVGVVGICGAGHLRRCLTALEKQIGVQSFEIVVAYDPALTDMSLLRGEFPAVRFVSNEGQRTPLELASRAIRETTREVVLLTEDHCIPAPDWVASMRAAIDTRCAAAGGLIVQEGDVTATDFAFYFVDFFRYAAATRVAPSPTLSVCNVAYRRSDLEQISDPPWRSFFHETAVNTALRARFGPLLLTPSSRVVMHRHVALGDAIRERYAFGRLFGATRLASSSPSMRVVYKILSPVLPAVLLARMALAALKSPALLSRFIRGFVPLTLMVFAWTLGEWLGYLTGRTSADLTVAPEAPIRP